MIIASIFSDNSFILSFMINETIVNDRSYPTIHFVWFDLMIIIKTMIIE